MAKKKDESPVGYESSSAVVVQLGRLFGQQSRIATNPARTPAQWRRQLRAVLDELARYVHANVDTDVVHEAMLAFSFEAARESLKSDDFWPGYTEAITRIALLLLGDYPDKRRKKSGRKADDFYELNLLRTVQWTQDRKQRDRTVFAASRFGFPKLTAAWEERNREFRAAHGYTVSRAQFIEWFRTMYPSDYAAIFR